MIKVKEARRVVLALNSQVERDTDTLEAIERMKHKDNPQIVTIRIQCEARIDLAKSILRALDFDDFVDLTTFTKYTTLPRN